MTTVAASKKFGSMACDQQFTYLHEVKMKGSTKIIELPTETSKKMFGIDKTFIGFAGNADVWGDVVTWLYTLDGKPPTCKRIEFLALNKGGIYHGTTLSNWFEIAEPHFAIGTGYQWAWAAMDNGKEPLEAVRAAGRRDPNTGMGYKNYSL